MPKFTSVQICRRCWDFLYGSRLPHRVLDAEQEPCEECGAPTESGIMVRKELRPW